MTNEIIAKDGTETAIDIDLHGLVNNTAEQSDSIVNSDNHPAALIGIRMTTSGTLPTADSAYIVYLFRRFTGDVSDDSASATKGAITPRNMHILGSITVSASGNTGFRKIFNTRNLGELGPEWGIAVKNRTGATSHATAAYFFAFYRYLTPELQDPP